MPLSVRSATTHISRIWASNMLALILPPDAFARVKDISIEEDPKNDSWLMTVTRWSDGGTVRLSLTHAEFARATLDAPISLSVETRATLVLFLS